MGLQIKVLPREIKRTCFYLLVLAISFALGACQPRDVDPRFGTIEAGKIGSLVTHPNSIDSPSVGFNFPINYVEVKDQTGEQLSTCKGGAWTDIRMYDKYEKERIYKEIYLGQRVAVLAHTNNCHKVGTRVRISSGGEKGSNYGEAVITKLMLVKRSELSDKALAAMDHDSESIGFFLKDEQMASIIVFKYVNGSAPKEEEYLNADVAVSGGGPASQGSGKVGNLIEDVTSLSSPSKDLVIEEALEAKTQVGEKLSTCSGGDWTDVRIYDKFDKDEIYESIYSGQRVAVLDHQKNCHTVGMRVRLSSTTDGDHSHYGEAVITGLYLVAKDKISDELLSEVDFTRDSLNSYLNEEKTASILSFKYIQGSAAQEAQYLNVKPTEASDSGETPDSGSASDDTNSGSDVAADESGSNTENNNNDDGSGDESGFSSDSGTQAGPVADIPGLTIHIGENNTGDITIVIGGEEGHPHRVEVISREGAHVEIIQNPSENNQTEQNQTEQNSQTLSLKTRAHEIEALGKDLQVLDYSNRKALLDSCSSKKPWRIYRNSTKLENELYAGKRVARISKGDLNCYQASDVLDIKGNEKEEAKGQVRIKEVFVMKKEDLSDELVSLTAQSREDLKAYLADADLINVTVFEYIEGSFNKDKN